jgi:type I restriction enzyme S subunit
MRSFKVRELLKIRNGRDHKELNSGEIPIYGSGGLMRFGDKYLYDKESILLPRKGTLSNIQWVNQPFWTVDTLYYTEINEDLVDGYYLFCYLRNLDLSKLNTGTGVPSMTFDAYYEIEVQLPGLREQREISQVLRRIKDKISLNNRINAELEAMAKTIYDYWFVQFDFPNELGKPYKSSCGKMVWNEELKREIPEGWEVKMFGDVVVIKNGKDHKHLNDGAFPVYGSGGVMRYADKYLFDDESILIPRKGSLENLFYMSKPFWCVDTIFYTQMKFDQSCKYLFYTAQNFNIAKMNTGTAVPSMTAGILNNLPLTFPSLVLLKSFDEILKPIFRKREMIINENQQLATLRDWLLPMLMNGQVTVKD